MFSVTTVTVTLLLLLLLLVSALQVNEILSRSSVWNAFKDQKHDLFISESQTAGYLTGTMGFHGCRWSDTFWPTPRCCCKPCGPLFSPFTFLPPAAAFLLVSSSGVSTPSLLAASSPLRGGL